jgi:hypothetical protein
VSELVDHLNAGMKCSVGKGGVFLHSFIADWAGKIRARVTLRCHLQAKLGMGSLPFNMCQGTLIV